MNDIAASPADAASLHAERERGVRHRGRGPRAVMGALLMLAALLGGAIAAAAVAPLFGIHLVRLATGSMAPSYPAGSLLLVIDVPAQSVAVGDVVTVRRADGASVTHRVVATEAIGAGASIRMRGDANDHDDPSPYNATRVGLVVFGVPAMGSLFALAESPGFVPVVAGITSLLVLWAWWPERSHPAHRMPRTSERSRR